jgi:hypothetical protein
MMSLKMRMLVVAVLLQPVISGGALAQTAGPVAGKAAIKALIGNTLVFTTPDDPGVKVSLYVLADRTGRYAKDGGDTTEKPESVQWSVREDGMFCVAATGATPQDGDCAAISIAGDDVTLKSKNDPAIAGKLLKGNPRKL